MGCFISRPPQPRRAASARQMSWDPSTLIQTIRRPKRPRTQPKLHPDQRQFTVRENNRRGYTVTEVYEPTGRELGNGNFGAVYKARHKMRDPNRRRRWDLVAIKATAPTILDVRSGPLETCEDLEKNCNEIKTLLRLQQQSDPRDSPVLHLYEYFWTYLGGDGSQNRPVGELILVTEHLGQDLDQWWRQEQQKSNGLIFESVAREISETLVGALDFIHRHKIVHRDIKMQNVMFRRNGDYQSLKVIDFGLAKVLDHDKAQANDFCGTKGYIAPEIYLGQPYGYEVDMFALGVMAFRLLSGNRPFHSNNANKLASDTINLRYTIMDNVWNGVTAEALHFVRKLLIGRDERLTAPLAVQHEWFRSREESVLHSDYSNFAATSSYSRAMVRTHVPAANDGPQSVGATTTVNRFWLDDRLYVPINILQIYNLYAGRIVNNNNNDEQQGDNLILLEEVMNHSLKPLPMYLGQLQRYNERECRRICRQAAQIVQILHSNKMAHRNIHLGSFVVDTKGKLLVRGLSNAQAAEDGQPLTGHFGYMHENFAFMAPEVDNDFFHDKAVDLWSLGAVICMMLTGLPPFRGDGKVLIANKHNGNVVFDAVLPSSSAQLLVRSLLQVNPVDRWTIEQVLDSEWMIEESSVLAGHDLTLATTFMSDWTRVSR